MDLAVSNVSVENNAYAMNIEASPANDSPRKPSHAGKLSDSGETFNKESIKRLVEEMQKNLDNLSVALQFSTYGENGHKIAVIVSDPETGKVIREIPSKDLQSLYAKMSELTGMLLNRVV
jgi:flagellar protein FlaG